MLISMIAALARNRVIGRDGDLPWHLPDDQAFFKAKTVGKPVLMGRLTFESIGGRPLPRRTNIIVTRDPDYRAPGCRVVHSLAEGVEAAGDVPELVVAGGEGIYEAMLPHAGRLYLTLIDAEVEGDTHFPEVDLDEWREIESTDHPADERHAHSFRMVVLERRASRE